MCKRKQASVGREPGRGSHSHRCPPCLGRGVVGEKQRAKEFHLWASSPLLTCNAGAFRSHSGRPKGDRGQRGDEERRVRGSRGRGRPFPSTRRRHGEAPQVARPLPLSPRRRSPSPGQLSRLLRPPSPRTALSSGRKRRGEKGRKHAGGSHLLRQRTAHVIAEGGLHLSVWLSGE